MKNPRLSQSIIFTSVLLGLFLSCSKDDAADPEIPQLADDLYLNAMYVDGKPYMAITYDEAKRIESIIEYEDGELSGKQLFEYNEGGELKTLWLTHPDGSFQVAYSYEYEGGKPVKMLVYSELLEDPTYAYTYEYNNSGQVSSEYHFVPSQPEKIQTYVKYEYDSHGNLTVKKNFNVQSDKPDVLYYEEHLGYNDPQKTAAIREKIGKRLTGKMFLYSSSEVTNYDNDGSGDIGFSYSYEVDIEYDPQGWPIQSDIAAHQTHPQYNDDTAVVTYDYVKL